MGGGKFQRKVGAQGEAHHGKAAFALSSPLVEKVCCGCDLGLGLERIGIEGFDEAFRVGNGVCEFAMIQVRRECYKALFSKACAESLHRIVQAPPGVKHKYTGSFASGWHGKKTIGLSCWHSYLLELFRHSCCLNETRL